MQEWTVWWGNVQVIPSRDVKVAGLMGPAAPIEKKSSAVADSHTGMGGTTTAKMASLVRPLSPPLLPSYCQSLLLVTCCSLEGKTWGQEWNGPSNCLMSHQLGRLKAAGREAETAQLHCISLTSALAHAEPG